MRSFDEHDLERWEDRFSKMNISAHFSYEGFGNLELRNTQRGHSTESLMGGTRKMFFTYSVSKKSYKRFKSILHSNLKEGIVIKYNRNRGANYVVSKYDNNIEPEETNIKIHGVDFILCEIMFNTTLEQLMVQITCIEDACTSISTYFSYDKNGEESNTLPFQLYDIVAYKDHDVNEEYLVKNIKFVRDQLTYRITHIAEKKGETIIFGNTHDALSDHLQKSRNSKLEDLLD